MKNKKKKGSYWFILWFVTAFYMLMITVYTFGSREIGAGFVGIVFTAAFALLGVYSLRKRLSKKAKPANNEVRDIQPQPQQPQRQPTEYEQRRAANIAAKSAAFAKLLDRIPRVPVVPAPVGSFVGDTELQPVSPMNITRRTNVDNLFPFVAIDTETTGVDPEHDEIIEVSAIKFGLDFKPKAAFSTLCKARGGIPATASRVNNITEEMVADCPYFEQVAAQFQEFISGCNILGHNVKFDARILNYNGVQFGSKARFFDTWELSKLMLTVPGDKVWNDELGHSVVVERPDVKNRKLSTVAEHYGIYRDDAHRSLSDCLATAAVFQKQVQRRTM